MGDQNEKQEFEKASAPTKTDETKMRDVLTAKLSDLWPKDVISCVSKVDYQHPA